MKQTFSNKYLDWILIAITLLFSISATFLLSVKIEFYTSYFIRIIFTLVPIVALVSLINENGNGERYSRFFIIVGLVSPSISICNQFLTDLLFYGINRINLIQDPFLYLQSLIGIALFIFTIKYSNQTKSDRIKDYGILIKYISAYLFVLMIIKIIESYFFIYSNRVSIWEIGIKTIISLIVFFLGYRLKNDTAKLRICLILTLFLLFLYELA